MHCVGRSSNASYCLYGLRIVPPKQLQVQSLLLSLHPIQSRISSSRIFLTLFSTKSSRLVNILARVEWIAYQCQLSFYLINSQSDPKPGFHCSLSCCRNVNHRFIFETLPGTLAQLVLLKSFIQRSLNHLISPA